MSQSRLIQGLLAPIRIPTSGFSGLFFKPVVVSSAGRPSVLLREAPPPTPIQQVREQPAISGAAQPLRTVSIAERLGNAAALEARSFAVYTRVQMLSELLNLDPSFSKSTSGKIGLNLEGLSFSGFAVFGMFAGQLRPVFMGMAGYAGNPLVPVDAAGKPLLHVLPQRESKTFEELRANPSLIQSILTDPIDPNWDEATYFADATTLLDATIAALRVVEGRVNAYQGVLDRCQAILATLGKQRDTVTQSLSSLAGNLAQARQDVSVARALLADEQARVAQINQRRQMVLTEHVPFLVYHRPRLSDALLTEPTRPLEPAVAEAEVPACLDSPATTPPQLQALLELLRDAPLKWFALGPSLLAQLDRLEVLRGVFGTAQQRAGFRTSVSFLAAGFGAVQGLFADALTRVYGIQAQAVWYYRQRLAFFELEALQQLAWRQAYQQALELMSLGDLIDAAHGQTELVNQASQELMAIGRVANCLYVRIAKVLPVIRLDWALRLAEYNAPVDLRDLSTLPRWGERDAHGTDVIPFLDRHAMQSLTDWLYQRVSPAQADAVLMVHDLVRSCILLASHAPVDQLAAGTVARETAAKVGSQIDLSVDQTLVHIGMHAIIYGATPGIAGSANTILARAVVEDLAQGRATVRILSALTEGLRLTTSHTVHFVDPERLRF